MKFKIGDYVKPYYWPNTIWCVEKINESGFAKIRHFYGEPEIPIELGFWAWIPSRKLIRIDPLTVLALVSQ